MNEKFKDFIKDAFVIVGMVISIGGIAILCLMIGFDEGRSYSEYVSNDRLQDCQKIITQSHP